MEDKERQMTPEGAAVYRVPECNLDSLKARVEKLNRRAKRLKMEPLVLAEIGEEFAQARRRTGEYDDAGNPEYEDYLARWVQVTLVGSCPRINGWAMAATIQHEDGGNLLRTVPGFEALLPLRYRTAGTECEHCDKDRRRNDTYVLHGETRHVNLNAGTPDVVEVIWKQVGRNCLSDFLRSPDASGLAEWAEVLAGLDDEIRQYEDDGEEGGGRGREYFTPLRLLTQVACCVRSEGWCSRTEAKASFGKLATVDSALSLWNKDVWKQLSAADRDKLTPTTEDETKAVEAIAWAAALPTDVGSDYLWNIRVLALKEYIGYREAGLAGSIIAAYNRHLEREMAAKYERDMPSEWFGTVGKREVFELTVIGKREMDGNYGLTTLVMFRDAAGNRAKWFCSGSCGFAVDSVVTVKATVKEHTEYKGCKQTGLSRVTEYDAVEEARLKANAKVIKKVLKKRGLECKHVGQWFTFAVPELDAMSVTGEWLQPCCRECSEAWAGKEVAA